MYKSAGSSGWFFAWLEISSPLLNLISLVASGQNKTIHSYIIINMNHWIKTHKSFKCHNWSVTQWENKLRLLFKPRLSLQIQFLSYFSSLFLGRIICTELSYIDSWLILRRKILHRIANWLQILFTLFNVIVKVLYTARSLAQQSKSCAPTFVLSQQRSLGITLNKP